MLVWKNLNGQTFFIFLDIKSKLYSFWLSTKHVSNLDNSLYILNQFSDRLFKYSKNILCSKSKHTRKLQFWVCVITANTLRTHCGHTAHLKIWLSTDEKKFTFNISRLIISVWTNVGCLSDGWIDSAIERKSIFNIWHSKSHFSSTVGCLSQRLDGFFSKSDMSVLTMVGCLSDGWIDISRERKSILNIWHSKSHSSSMVGCLSQWLDVFFQIDMSVLTMVGCLSDGWIDISR